MNEKHLTYFKVENFKRFESFEMDNIGQFNLILGDNNVGKTSVLEALLFDEESLESYITNFAKILEQKQIATLRRNLNSTNDIEDNNLLFFTHKNQDLAIITTFSYSDKPKEQLSIVADSEFALSQKYPEQYRDFFKNKSQEDISFRLFLLMQWNEKFRFSRWQFLLMQQPNHKKEIPMVFFAQTYQEDLIQFYSDYVQENKEEFLKALKLFIPEITDIEIKVKQRQGILYVRGGGAFMPLSFYGDGVNRLVRILLQIPSCKGRRIMIDEIDAGIHFKRFKDFLRIILLAAKQNDVQIFATTHNTECLQAFKEVLEEKEEYFQNKARTITLFQTKDNNIQARTRNFEAFQEAIDEGYNIRGGE